ncbi:hypothetical protein LPJ61_005906, partial [Coemansia biformis]
MSASQVDEDSAREAQAWGPPPDSAPDSPNGSQASPRAGSGEDIDDLFTEDVATARASRKIRQILGQRRQQETAGWAPLRRGLHIVFYEPFSLPARLYMVFSTAVLLLFLIVFMIDTMPQYRIRADWRRIADLVSLTTAAYFAAEWLLRFYAFAHPARYLFQPLVIVDVLGIFPGFIPYGSGTNGYWSKLKWLRALQILRVLRLLRIAVYSVELYVTIRTLRKSLVQILVVMVVIFILMLTASFLLFYAENDSLDAVTVKWMRKRGGVVEVSPFQNVFFCLYWGFVTITTVGYGDYTPVSPWGQVIACFTMLMGVFMIVFPTSIISNNFATEWQAFQRAQKLSDERRLHRRNRSGRHELSQLYNYANMPYGADADAPMAPEGEQAGQSHFIVPSGADSRPDSLPSASAPLTGHSHIGPVGYAKLIDLSRKVEKDFGMPPMALDNIEDGNEVSKSLLISAVHSKLYTEALATLCERMVLRLMDDTGIATTEAIAGYLRYHPDAVGTAHGRPHGGRLSVLEYRALEYVVGNLAGQ